MVPDTDDADANIEYVPDGWTPGSVQANGIEIGYYRVGDRDAPTVVVAHGFYEDARCMVPVVDALAAEGYHVVAYDARGHGQTEGPEAGYAPADRVDDLVALLDALDHGEPVLYGHSMGGGTVAATAAEHGDRIRGVVMEDPSSMRGTPDADLDEIAAYVGDEIAEAHEQSIDELAAEYAEEEPELVDRYPALAEAYAHADHCLSPNLVAQARELPALLDELFPEIAVPALVLRRDVDTEERARDLELAATMPKGRLVHVPEAEHHVVASRPEPALAEIRAFLEHIA